MYRLLLTITQGVERHHQQEFPVQTLQTELLFRIQEARVKLNKLKLREVRQPPKVIVRIQGRNTIVLAEHIRQVIAILEQAQGQHIITAGQPKAVALFQLQRDVLNLLEHTELLHRLPHQDHQVQAVAAIRRDHRVQVRETRRILAQAVVVILRVHRLLHLQVLRHQDLQVHQALHHPEDRISFSNNNLKSF